MEHNEATGNKPSWWQRWQRGQALVEYWPALPVGVMVMISASALVGPVGQAFQKTADGLNNVVCEQPETGPTYTDLDGGHRIEVIASNYDEDNDRTTVTFRVSSGDQPSISHWVLGIDEATSNRIVSTTEAYENYQRDPTTGKWGIKFDTGYEGNGGGGGGNEGGGPPEGAGGPPPGRGPRNKMVSFQKSFVSTKIIYRPVMNTYVEARDITLTLTGYVDFVEQIEVTTKAGLDVASGYVTVPTPSGSSTTETC